MNQIPNEAASDVTQKLKFETDVLFRGEQRSLSFDYEGDGVIVWCFDGENTCHGEDATEAEQQEVYDQLWSWLIGHWEWCNDAD